MPQFNNLSIVIQGPLHQNSIDALSYYKKIGNVIFSHWSTDNPKLDTDINGDGVTRIPLELPRNPNIFNNQNVYYQIYNTYFGIDMVKTEFVIKVRSDEYIGNLAPLIQKVFQNPNKMVTGNIHFRPDRLAKFHICDKIFGGITKDLLNAFKVAKKRCESHQLMLMAGIYEYDESFDPKKYQGLYGKWSAGAPVFTKEGELPLIGTARQLNNNHVGIYAETLIGTSYLIGKGVFPDRGNSKEIVKNNFEIVRVEEMVPYKNKYGDTNIPHNWEEIDRIEDL